MHVKYLSAVPSSEDMTLDTEQDASFPAAARMHVLVQLSEVPCSQAAVFIAGA